MRNSIFIILLLLFFSCKNVSEEYLSERTVLIYMVAENNLDPFSIKDINEMESAWNNSFNGNLLVYLDRSEGASSPHPSLFKITYDNEEKVISPIVKIYKEQDSTKKEVINGILKYVIKNFPAKSHGLVFWSHGSGWLPKDFEKEKSRSFGLDKGNSINIDELASVIPIKYDFIIFDACYIGTIEVAYELKDKCDFLIFSSSEVLSDGYPYNEITPHFFEEKIDYRKIATAFYDFYNNNEDIYKKSATVSIINTSELSNLANTVEKMINYNPKIFSIDSSKIQEFALSWEMSELFYDMGHFIYRSYEESMIPENLKDEIFTQLNKTVIYKAATPRFFDILEINNFSGLSIYFYDKEKSNLNSYYKNLKWYMECNYESIVSF